MFTDAIAGYLRIESVYGDIVLTLNKLFHDWPKRTVVRDSELRKHYGHTATLYKDPYTDAVSLYCEQCKVKLIVNVGRQ
jgi:hypothetical protein